MSAVNEVMIRKCFTKWEPVVDIVIPSSRFNGVSPGPRQLPRCWGFVHFPPTAEGERAAADAIKNLNGTTISELRVRTRRDARLRARLVLLFLSPPFEPPLGAVVNLCSARILGIFYARVTLSGKVFLSLFLVKYRSFVLFCFFVILEVP